MSVNIADRVNRVFRRQLVLTAVLGLVLAALFSYILLGLRPTQNRYQDGARALELAHAAMIDQETGLRGYLLVHDDVFLQPYHQGVADVREQDKVLLMMSATGSTTASRRCQQRRCGVGVRAEAAAQTAARPEIKATPRRSSRLLRTISANRIDAKSTQRVLAGAELVAEHELLDMRVAQQTWASEWATGHRRRQGTD